MGEEGEEGEEGGREGGRRRKGTAFRVEQRETASEGMHGAYQLMVTSLVRHCPTSEKVVYADERPERLYKYMYHNVYLLTVRRKGS